MVIDVSSYVGMWPYWENPYCDSTGDGLVRLMDKWKLDRSFIISTKALFYDDIAGNEMAFAAAARHPGRLLPTVSAAIFADGERDHGAYLRECVQRGARLLKLYPLYHGYRLTPTLKRLDNLMYTAEELNLPVSVPIKLFMSFGLPSVPLAEVTAFADYYPEVTFLFDGFNQADIYILGEYAEERKNAYYGLSSLSAFHGIEKAVRYLGARRLLFATGAPLEYVLPFLARVEHAELSAEERSLILGGNAQRLFGLSSDEGRLLA